MARTGLRATPLAQRAGIAPSTLLRALDPDRPTSLERRTIERLADATGVAPPWNAAPGGGGFSDADTAPWSAADDAASPVDQAPLPVDQYWKVVRTRALELAGILPGDLLLFDQSLDANADDVVEAQVYSLDSRTAETVLRLYEPPTLVTRTMDPALTGRPVARPLIVDGERVRIVAVMLKVSRVREKKLR